MKRRPWTPADDAMLRAEYAHTLTAELARRIGRPASSLHGRAKRLGLRKSPEFFESDKSGRLTRGRAFLGIAHRFRPGHVPANTGKRGVRYSPATEFAKGSRPHNWVPIGSLRVHSSGYLQRKMTDTGYSPRDWVMVHRLVWEAAHGPIPDGMWVAFRPGRRTAVLEDITVDALELVTRGELMRRNSIHAMPRELAELSRLRGRITREINAREKDAA